MDTWNGIGKVHKEAIVAMVAFYLKVIATGVLLAMIATFFISIVMVPELIFWIAAIAIMFAIMAIFHLY